MNTVSDTFVVQFEFGADWATEKNSNFAEVWDGPVMVANLIRTGDEWVINDVESGYDFHNAPESFATVAEFVAFIHEELNA
jgi:hypothetical protein